MSKIAPPPQRTSAAAAAAKSLQSCLTLCNPIDGSPPGSAIPGILPARTLEWVAISFSNAWKWKVKVKSLSVSDSQWPHGLQPTRLLCPWDFPGMGFSRHWIFQWGAIAFSGTCLMEALLVSEFSFLNVYLKNCNFLYLLLHDVYIGISCQCVLKKLAFCKKRCIQMSEEVLS